MKLRLFKRFLLYVTAALILATLAVGLVNTYLGVHSPVRPAVDRVVSLLPPLPAFLKGGTVDSQSVPVIQASQNPIVSAGRGAWHQSIDETSRLCGAPDVSTVPVWSQRTAYTWVNEDGVRSFGDTAPSTLPAQTLGVDEGNRDFKIRVTWEGAKPDPALEGQLRAGATRIYEQWGQWIGLDSLVRSQVTLRITSDRKRFLADWGGDANGPIPSGFYSLASNEAVAFYDASKVSEARLLEVIFHEVAHLISTWQVGPLPPWYTEGLAEYFETMQLQWQSAEFRTRSQWSEQVARPGLMPLQQLFSLDAERWFTGDVHQRYLTAGALIAFMATTDRGREELKALAQQAQKARCAPRKTKQHWTPSGYPGGIKGLERELRRWLS